MLRTLGILLHDVILELGFAAGVLLALRFFALGGTGL
jgi:hypothetical protein